jgi:hypothetical protein
MQTTPRPRRRGVGVGGEAGALLIARVDDLQRAGFELLEERQDEVAGHAEDVADALLLEAPDQVIADRFVRRRARLSRRAPNALFAVSRGGNALRHLRFPLSSKSDALHARSRSRCGASANKRYSRKSPERPADRFGKVNALHNAG